MQLSIKKYLIKQSNMKPLCKLHTQGNKRHGEGENVFKLTFQLKFYLDYEKQTDKNKMIGYKKSM